MKLTLFILLLLVGKSSSTQIKISNDKSKWLPQNTTYGLAYRRMAIDSVWVPPHYADTPTIPSADRLAWKYSIGIREANNHLYIYDGLKWNDASVTSGSGGSESDPIFASSPSSGITPTNISNWNTAFSWGNHAAAGYLTNTSGDVRYYTKTAADSRYLQSFTELDPKRTVAIAVTGTTAKTITVTLADGSTVTNTFADEVGAGGSGLASLNGLAASSQIFATGTAGTDFNIVSSGSTHTFNFPTASASNRGLLSSANWSTFNGKQAALSGTGFIKASGTTISYDNSTYVVANTSITPATATKLTYDAKGLITGSTSLLAGDVPTLNQNTTGSAGSVSGTNIISNSNLSQVPASTFKGNNTGAAASPLDLTVTQATAMLSLFTSSAKGLVPAPSTVSGRVLMDNGTWGTIAVATESDPVVRAINGIVHSNGTTISAAVAGNFPTLNQNTTGSAASISASNAISNSNIVQMAATTIKGNASGSSANQADLTPAQVTGMLSTFTTASKGFVPASVTSNTTDFLRRDGAWGDPIGTTEDITTATATFTNKRITLRTQTITSSSSVTPNADNDDVVKITAQAASLTFVNPIGTPTSSQKIVIFVHNNGTGRPVFFGTQYRVVGVTLPSTTVANKVLRIEMEWDAEDNKWDVVQINQES
jgi:hypothetical protein